jgi:site-specific recombinase XerD
MENKVELSQLFWRRLRGRIRGSQAVTSDKVPTNTELRMIMSHLPINGKAFFLMLSSSGMRIGEALKLKQDDVDLTSTPARIEIRAEYTKSGNRRTVFMSGESRESIVEWLKSRDQYLVTSSARSTMHPKSVKDDRLFPFNADTAYMMWDIALAKSKNDERDKTTNVHRIHVHVLRKFFRTRLGGVIPVDVVEFLMGHEGYLTSEYRRYEDSQLVDFYKKGEHALLVFTESADVERFREEVRKNNEQLQGRVDRLTDDNLELRGTLKEVRSMLRERTMTESEIKTVIKTLMSIPLGIPVVDYPETERTLRDMTDEESSKWREDQEKKFDRQMETAMNIVKKWEAKKNDNEPVES